MDFPSCDIFQSEGETDKEDLQTVMMKERANYTVRSCLPCVDPAALGSKALSASPVLSRSGLTRIFQCPRRASV